jgi:NTE family protein
MVKTALVLAGGGARGSYELGVWKALREMDIEIHMVTGTSIGAINGAAIAQGDFELAITLWKIIETSHVFDININENIRLDRKIIKTYQNFIINALKNGGTELNALKNTLISFIDEKAVRASSIEFGLVTYEMDTKKPHELFISDIPNGELIEYILASASIYPVFRPHVINNVRFIDGAYYDNLPIKMAIEKGANNIIAVDLNAFGIINNESFSLSRSLTYIKSYWNLGPTLVFDREEIRRNIRLGYLDTFKAFNIYEGFAFTYYSGFCKEVDNKLSHFLPLEDLIQKSGDGVINQFFINYVEKVINSRHIHNAN